MVGKVINFRAICFLKGFYQKMHKFKSVRFYSRKKIDTKPFYFAFLKINPLKDYMLGVLSNKDESEWKGYKRRNTKIGEYTEVNAKGI